MKTIQQFEGIQTLDNAPRAWAAKWTEGIDVKDRTRAAYRKNIGYYLAWLEVSGRTGGLRADIIAYKEYLTATYSAATVSAYLTAVRGFYSWLNETLGAPDIAKGIKGTKKAKGFRKDPLSIQQIRAVLGAIGTDTLEDLRDYAILSLMIHTGLRVIEVQGADVSDIRNVMGRSVLFIQGKGRDEKDAYVILDSGVLQAILNYLQARGESLDTSGPLFASVSDRNDGGRLTVRSISRIVKERFRAVGIDSGRLTAHSLRHTAITLALLGGATVQQAQAMARH